MFFIPRITCVKIKNFKIKNIFHTVWCIPDNQWKSDWKVKKYVCVVCTQNTKILMKQTCFYGPVSVKYQYIIKITAIPGVLEAGSSGHAQPAYCHSHWMMSSNICSRWRKFDYWGPIKETKTITIDSIIQGFSCTWNLLILSTILLSWIPLMFSSLPSTLCTLKMW